MLTNLYIKNLALIKEENIDFEEGLTVLTGETGAGKSVLLGAISAALGLKAPADLLKNKENDGVIQVSFYFNDKKFLEKLGDLCGVELSDGDIIILRKISSGRSQYRLNGISVSASQIKAIAPYLLELHAQRDNLLLLKEENQLALIDSFCDESFFGCLKKAEELYKKYSDVKRNIDFLGEDDESAQREAQLLEFEINELENARLSVGEDNSLEEIFIKGQNLQKITQALSRAHGLLSDGENDAISAVGSAMKYIGEALEYDKGLSDIYSMLGDAEGILSDVSGELFSYSQGLDLDEEEFDLVTQRLNVYNHLKMKYNTDTEGLLKLLLQKQDRYDILQNANVYRDKLQKEKEDLEKSMDLIYEELTKSRKKAAAELSKKIEDAAKDLNFNTVRFHIEINRTGQYSKSGDNTAAFMVSFNTGQPLSPISECASGGELSRIMLAVKSAVALKDDTDTLIFDEIDTGISGRTAQKVAEKLAQMSGDRQIISITHLPQIAAMADHHFLIKKTASKDSTVTQTMILDDESSVEELSRILGGSSITQAVRANAKEMKTLAKEYKSNNKYKNVTKK